MIKTTALLLAALLLASPAAFAQAQQNFDNGDDTPAPRGNVNGAAAAQLNQRIDQLEQQVRTLTNDLEKSRYQTMQIMSHLERLGQDLEIRFSEIERRQQAAALPPPTVIDGAAAAAPATPVAMPEEAPLDAGNTTPQTLYDEGFGKLRKADYPGAEAAFRRFLSAYPKDKLAGNANYWLGETYYVRGQFKEAAVAFAEGYQKYPKNSKAPDNLLKLGLALSALGSKDDACLTFGELKEKYPKAGESILDRAQQERTKLGCK